jgi:hypothetical protein
MFMPTGNQLEFHLPAPPVGGDTPLIPARMVNEFVYCPRLAYLMWTQGERFGFQKTLARQHFADAPLVEMQRGGNVVLTRSAKAHFPDGDRAWSRVSLGELFEARITGTPAARADCPAVRRPLPLPNIYG